MKKIVSIIAISILNSIATNAANAADVWPVGIRCETHIAGTAQEFTNTSSGPWVTLTQYFTIDNGSYVLTAETSNRASWGVIRLKNLDTRKSQTKYGPVVSMEVFELEFEDLKIRCQQFPYIGG